MGKHDALSISEIESIIKDKTLPIQDRMQCLFLAKDYGGILGLTALQGALNDTSVLLVHEAVYLVGQLGIKSAVPWLTSILDDKSKHSMIRHEAAEALAAIGDPESIDVIRRNLNDPSGPVQDTCFLALHSLENKQHVDEKQQTSVKRSKFLTVDPISKINYTFQILSSDQLKQMLLDSQLSLVERYQALFELRDRSNLESFEAIIEALQFDTSSALLRHEVAFVLGQLQLRESFQVLALCLSNKSEHVMARHEAALALASVAMKNHDLITKALDVLQMYSRDPSEIVAQSCVVGIDMINSS